MMINSSNFSALLILTEHHHDPAERLRKAIELQEALDTTHLPFGLREQYRARLQALLPKQDEQH